MKNKSLLFSIIGVAVVVTVGVFVAYPIIKGSEPLPVYNPADINPKLVDASLQGQTHSHRVGDFELINQRGKTVTQSNYEGKIYVADFFFATCQSICPKMSTQMERMSDVFSSDNEVMFISHSVMPEADSVPVLRDYALQYEADPAKWNLCTGTKAHIYDLARKHYFAVTTEGDGGESDFIHTENFVLVDKDKRLRGFYDGTSPEEVNRCIDDIKKLKEEYATATTS